MAERDFIEFHDCVYSGGPEVKSLPRIAWELTGASQSIRYRLSLFFAKKRRKPPDGRMRL